MNHRIPARIPTVVCHYKHFASMDENTEIARPSPRGYPTRRRILTIYQVIVAMVAHTSHAFPSPVGTACQSLGRPDVPSLSSSCTSPCPRLRKTLALIVPGLSHARRAPNPLCDADICRGCHLRRASAVGAKPGRYETHQVYWRPCIHLFGSLSDMVV